MKSLAIVPEITKEENLLKQNGQTLVEFVMLLAIIMIISLAYMKTVNSGIGKYWESMGNTLMSDVPNSKKLELR